VFSFPFFIAAVAVFVIIVVIVVHDNIFLSVCFITMPKCRVVLFLDAWFQTVRRFFDAFRIMVIVALLE